MKRVFGKAEAVFDGCYLLAALIIGVRLLLRGETLAGAMALVLAGGDAFHLIPRIRVIQTGQERRLAAALGRGKQITSVTMTVFYLLLWHLAGARAENAALSSTGWQAAVYALAAVRIALCLLPQNQWREREPPRGWSIARNVPFFLLGLLVAARYWCSRAVLPDMAWVWLAIALSFLFYLPVVLWSGRNPKIGMLMLPKTCMYLWILLLC